VLWVWIDVEFIVGRCGGDQVGGGVQQSVRKVEREAERSYMSKIWARNVRAV
jgi:hypothetical protein